MKKAELKNEVAAVLKLMDNSADTSAAIEQILRAVYVAGVKFGAVEGYNVGYTDGKRKVVKAGSEAVVDRVQSRANRAVAG